METRTLGKTNLVVSRLGLGLAALGRPGYINLGHADDLQKEYDRNIMQARAHAVLDAAWEGGARYFDAARSYGRAETFLATWLAARHIAPESVTVGSKWGYTYTAAWQVAAARHEVKEHSLPVLLRQISESRQLLGGYLGLYQIHSATLDSGVLENQAVLDELARLRTNGLKIGLTLTGPNQAATLKKARSIIKAGVPVFDCVQATWNLLEQSAGPELQTAHNAGMGVIIKEALANGRLSGRNQEAGFASQRRLLGDEATRRGTTVDALCLAAVLAQSWVDVVLSGAAAVEHLRSNLAAPAIVWDQDAADRLQVIAESPTEYWSTRRQLPWN